MEEKNTHYVCAGACGAVFDHPQDCQAKACAFYGRPMQKCDCTDGSHRAGIPASAAPASA